MRLMMSASPSTTLDYSGGGGAGESSPVETVNQDQPSTQEPVWLGLTQTTWVKIGIVAGLMAALFAPSLRRLWLKTNPFTGEANWGHSVIIPLIGLYYLYIHRDELLRAPLSTNYFGIPTRWRLISTGAMVLAGLLSWFVAGPAIFPAKAEYLTALGQGLVLWGVMALVFNWGLGSLLYGILIYGYGIWPGQNDFVKDLGMVITLFGVVLTLTGWNVMKIAWFPIAFLICALPWPGLMYSAIAGPLQQLAARVAVFVLKVTQVEAGRWGTKIFISGEGGEIRTLNVAEACAGLRSLMTFISVGAAVAFLSSRPLWQKIFITLSAIPIAIFCNVMRVSGQGVLDHYVSQDLAEGFAHSFVGLIMLIPAFFLILLVGWMLDKIFMEEVDELDLVKQAAASGKVVAAVRAQQQGLVVDVPRRATARVAAGPAAPQAARPVATAKAVAAPPPPAGKSPASKAATTAAPVAAKPVAPVVPKAPAARVSPPAPASAPKPPPAVRPAGAVPPAARPRPAGSAPIPPPPAGASVRKPAVQPPQQRQEGQQK